MTTSTFTFAIDGYQIGERILEGVRFNITCQGDPAQKLTVTDVSVEPSAAAYFATLNRTMWTAHITRYAESVLDQLVATGDALEALCDLDDGYLVF